MEHPIDNPFQITKPVGPDEVIDRNDETAKLSALAEEGNNARLVAPRRFGKTSLLDRVQYQLADRGGWITVYVDLLGIVTLDDLSARIERSYANALIGPIARWFTGLRRTLRPMLTLGGGPVPVSGSIDLSGGQREALVDRLALPVKVSERTGNRVHVVFDEFQELDVVGQQSDALVRSEIQHHSDAASYVFAGSNVRMMEMLFSDRNRAFYGQTEPVRLAPLADEALAEYIDDRFQRTGKEVEAAALGALLDLVRGHPQRAMAAAHALWDAAGLVADVDEWESARSALMSNVSDELKSGWFAMGASERQALVAIAKGEGPFACRGNRSRGGTVSSALKSLEDNATIVRVEGSWKVVDPLMQAWVSQGRDSLD